MLTINKAGQNWVFENIVVPYLNAKIQEDWHTVKNSWFTDIEECILNTYQGDDIVYVIHKQFTIDKQEFIFKIHDNFITTYFDRRITDAII
jgi:hypothetical protein